MISKKLKNAVKLSDLRSYEIAQRAGIHPATLSQLINEIVPVKLSDPRVIAVGRIFGFAAEECFDDKTNS